LLNVVIPRRTLAHALAVDFGIDEDDNFGFEPLTIVDLNRTKTLTRLVETIILDLNDEASFFKAPLIGAQAERTLLFLLLKCIPHRYLPVLNEPPARIAPFYVRRAETYMREHMHTDVTIEMLTSISGVSARTLYYGFKDHRKLTPMKYLKKMRLTQARGALLEARLTGTKVGRIAEQVGYTNFSQFGRDYKALFGESPVMTLRDRSMPQ
jgi:AraC-like DNA-binding protein